MQNQYENHYEILKMDAQIFAYLDEHDLYIVTDKKKVPLQDIKKPAVVIVGNTAYFAKEGKFIMLSKDKELQVENLTLPKEIIPTTDKQGKVDKTKNTQKVSQMMDAVIKKKVDRQYKILSLLHHPDKSAKNSDQFLAITTASEVLSDKKSREEYTPSLKEQLKHSEKHKVLFSEEGKKAAKNLTPIIDSNKIGELIKYAKECNEKLSYELKQKKQEILKNNLGKSDEIKNQLKDIEEIYQNEIDNNLMIARFCTTRGARVKMLEEFPEIYADILKTSKNKKSKNESLDTDDIKKYMKDSFFTQDVLEQDSITASTSSGTESDSDDLDEATSKAMVLVGEVDYKTIEHNFPIPNNIMKRLTQSSAIKFLVSSKDQVSVDKQEQAVSEDQVIKDPTNSAGQSQQLAKKVVTNEDVINKIKDLIQGPTNSSGIQDMQKLFKNGNTPTLQQLKACVPNDKELMWCGFFTKGQFAKSQVFGRGRLAWADKLYAAFNAVTDVNNSNQLNKFYSELTEVVNAKTVQTAKDKATLDQFDAGTFKFS